MRPVRVRHEGGGVYCYGWRGEVVGRLRFDPVTFVVERLDGAAGLPELDPYLTAALAVRSHWTRTGKFPDLVDAADPPQESDAPSPRREAETVARSGRLRFPARRAVSVSELAQRRPPAPS